MRSGMSFTCGESGLLENKPQRDFWMLSAYLVPVLRKDEIEKGAEDLLLRRCRMLDLTVMKNYIRMADDD